MHSRVPQVGSAPKSVRERQNPTQLAGQPFNVGRDASRAGLEQFQNRAAPGLKAHLFCI